MTDDPKTNTGTGVHRPDIVIVGFNGTKSARTIPPCPKCEDRSRVEETTANVDGVPTTAWTCGRCGTRWGADKSPPSDLLTTDYR